MVPVFTSREVVVVVGFLKIILHGVKVSSTREHILWVTLMDLWEREKKFFLPAVSIHFYPMSP